MLLTHPHHCSVHIPPLCSEKKLVISVFSVNNLHTRWVKDCATFRDLYEQVQDLDVSQKIGWGPLLQDKLVR